MFASESLIHWMFIVDSKWRQQVKSLPLALKCPHGVPAFCAMGSRGYLSWGRGRTQTQTGHFSEERCNCCAVGQETSFSSLLYCLGGDSHQIDTSPKLEEEEGVSLSTAENPQENKHKILDWGELIFLLKKHCFFSGALELKHPLFRQPRPEAGSSTQCCCSVPRWLSIPCLHFLRYILEIPLLRI